MQKKWTRILFAGCTVACIAPLASANDVAYSNMQRRMPNSARHASAGHDARQMAYATDMGGYDEPLPGGVQMPELSMSTAEPIYDQYMGCSGNGCCGCDSCYQQSPCYACESCPPQKGMFYAEAQLMFLRAHVLENSVGKLSETYEFTPRFIVGYESPSAFGVRSRYWIYDETTDNLGNPGQDLGINFDVVDVEGTARFCSGHLDLLLSGGFRWAGAEIDLNDEIVSSDLIGLTAAADARVRLCETCHSQWAGVCGVRWSLLGGSWDGDTAGFVLPLEDDNVVVQEIYGGVEYARHYAKFDLYARIVFEMQNWHSDAFSQTAFTDSIGFVGPAMHIGGTF